ncbi:carbohydrate kinase family protein [Trueperella pyogenes]|uniref:carbohydrate kinase family protein n=1 Tax=Trueperella pyogenes TaxID=1661 RepID=UPI00242CF814|nr:carbohydrate kinase [Trueperella pyogenes]MCI7689988.1 carbohydrate kinase [Trueperella pyogenes]WHU58042.1 carbohydrate kinase [Trueperella pyogenes]
MSCLVIGESLIDVVKRGPATTRHPGGSPLNVAVGLARLGRPVKLLTRIGADPDGETIRDYVESAGVELVDGAVDTAATSIALAALDEHGHATYRFDVYSAYADPPAVGEEREMLLAHPPLHVHIGSIGAHLRPGATTVRRWIELLSPHSTISYDPNVRLSILGSVESVLADMDAMLPFVDIVKASTEDLSVLFKNDIDPVLTAQWFFERGVKFVAITDGARGARFCTPHTSAHVPAPQVQIVDTVGAGDAMMAALIDSLARISVLGDDRAGLTSISPQMLHSVGEYASRAAGITISRAGANPPTRAELNDVVAGLS